MKKNWISLGLMSGTSGDGVDASLIKTNGLNEYKFCRQIFWIWL